MSDSELEAAIREFHEEIPHRFQVSLTMSMETRDRLRRIREELNDVVGEQLFTTDDAIRLALVSGARYHELATDEDATTESDSVAALAAPLRRVVEAAEGEEEE